MKNIILSILLSFMLVLPVFGNPSERLLDAIEQVESNGCETAIGDNGEAFGSFQLHWGYIQDVNRIKGTNFTHRDAFNRNVSRFIVRSYLIHYGKLYQRKTGEEPTDEIYARIHNGGPRGWDKSNKRRYSNTTRYWLKVKKIYYNVNKPTQK